MKIRFLIFGLIWIGFWMSGAEISIHAQDSVICDRNEPYWERWQTNAEFRSRMTSSIWNVTSFDISPDGATLAVANVSTLILYDTQTLTPTIKLKSPNMVQGINYGGSYQAVKWSPDGKQLAAAYFVYDDPDNPSPANGIQIWDVGQQQQLDLLSGRPQAIDWSPNSSMLAEADAFSGDIWLWDLERRISYKLYERDPMHGYAANLLVWSPNGRYLAASDSYHGAVYIYALEEDEPQLINSPDEIASYVAWSPNSDQVVTGSWVASYLYLFDVSTGELTKTLNGSEHNPLDLQWSPDGAWLARGTQNGLYLWDMSSDDTTPARVFNEHMPPFVRMAWTPEGQSLISVDFEGSLYHWDVETGCVEAAYLKEWKPGS